MKRSRLYSVWKRISSVAIIQLFLGEVKASPSSSLINHMITEKSAHCAYFELDEVKNSQKAHIDLISRGEFWGGRRDITKLAAHDKLFHIN